jgi:hypothetical protein
VGIMSTNKEDKNNVKEIFISTKSSAQKNNTKVAVKTLSGAPIPRKAMANCIEISVLTKNNRLLNNSNIKGTIKGYKNFSALGS